MTITKIRVRNPYFETEYEVQESPEQIENMINNVWRGNEDFIFVHTLKNMPLSISPKNNASVEVFTIERDISVVAG